MANFSQSSLRKLRELDVDLQTVLYGAILIMDFTVLSGRRNKTEQDRLVLEGKSKLLYPRSKHNKNPSLAVDIAPYPIDWKDKERFILLAGVIKTIAIQKGIWIRWGGDWDGDGYMLDERFRDLGHFEIVRE